MVPGNTEFVLLSIRIPCQKLRTGHLSIARKKCLKSVFPKYRRVGGHDDLDLQLSCNSYDLVRDLRLFSLVEV